MVTSVLSDVNSLPVNTFFPKMTRVFLGEGRVSEKIRKTTMGGSKRAKNNNNNKACVLCAVP